jgi:predicted permease
LGQVYVLPGEPTMTLLERMIIGALTVILAAPIYALVAKAKKNRILGHKFSKRTNYVVLFGLIVLLLVIYIVRK